MFTPSDAISRIPLRKAAAVLPSYLLVSAFPTFMAGDPANPPPSGGYAFETALCLVESQSPLLRPAFDGHARGASTTIAEHEAHVLLGRVRSLAKLLAGVRGHLDLDDWRKLLDVAARVATELTAALNEIGERLATDPARNPAERARMSCALAEAQWLADRLRDARLSLCRSAERVH